MCLPHIIFMYSYEYHNKHPFISPTALTIWTVCLRCGVVCNVGTNNSLYGSNAVVFDDSTKQSN
jgi:hypothetical protein